MLLAIDTSTGTSVAVVDRDGVRAVRTSADTRGHAEVVGSFIAEVLAEAGVTPPELEAVAVGMGPGPFTGLRVGIAAARTFALGIARPVLAVVSHDAVAFGVSRQLSAHALGRPPHDPRRRALVWSALRRRAGQPDAGLANRRAATARRRPRRVTTPSLAARLQPAAHGAQPTSSAQPATSSMNGGQVASSSCVLMRGANSIKAPP